MRLASRLCFELGQLPEALNHAKALLREAPTADSWGLQATLFLETGKLAAVLACATRTSPPLCRQLQAMCMAMEGEFENALKVLRELPEPPSDDLGVVSDQQDVLFLQRVHIALLNGWNSTAGADLDRLRSHQAWQRRHVRIHVDALDAWAHAIGGQREQAMQLVRLVSARLPALAHQQLLLRRCHLLLGCALAMLGELTEAVQHWHRAKSPASPVIHAEALYRIAEQQPSVEAWVEVASLAVDTWPVARARKRVSGA